MSLGFDSIEMVFKGQRKNPLLSLISTLINQEKSIATTFFNDTQVTSLVPPEFEVEDCPSIDNVEAANCLECKQNLTCPLFLIASKFLADGGVIRTNVDELTQ